MEAQFHLHHATSQLTRYFHMISVLSPKIADLMADVLAEYRSPAAYDNFKQLIMARSTISERARLYQLLKEEELGDRRPYHLLRLMRQALGFADSPGSSFTLCHLSGALFTTPSTTDAYNP